MSTTISNLKMLVAKNKVEAALTEMLTRNELIRSCNHLNELILLSMSYYQLKDLEHRSLVTAEQYNVQCIRLASNLLLFLDKVQGTSLGSKSNNRL